MGGLKLYGGLAVASVGLVVAALVLPATSWIFNTAYWVGRSGPVDYGNTEEAKLLEARDLPNYHPYPQQAEFINQRNIEVTRQALAMNTPGSLSVAMRAVGQGTTFSTQNGGYTDAKKNLAGLQMKLSLAGMALEKDNSYWPVMASAANHILGNQREEDRYFTIASQCPRFDDHAYYEAELRANLLESVRGKLGSQQEVVAFSSILLPHFATIKGLCRSRTGNRPLKESAERRAEVARFSLVLAKTTDTYIGLLVGVAVSVSSYSSRDWTEDPRTAEGKNPVLFTSEQIKKETTPEQADLLLRAMDLQKLKTRFEERNTDAEVEWRAIGESRPQQSAITLGLGLLLTLPVVLLGRRMAAWRESETAARAFAFLAPLVLVFGMAVSGAHMKTEGMAWVMVLAALGPLVFAALSIPLDFKWVEKVLLGLNAVGFLGFGVFAISMPAITGLSVLAAALPILLRASRTSKFLAVYSWLGWLAWTGSLLYVSTTIYVNDEAGFGNSPFEPAVGRLWVVAFCALLGGVGVGALVPPGAKGLWRQASAVQGVLIVAFVAALGYNISRDKTMAKYIPNERGLVREYQEDVRVPGGL